MTGCFNCGHTFEDHGGDPDGPCARCSCEHWQEAEARRPVIDRNTFGIPDSLWALARLERFRSVPLWTGYDYGIRFMPAAKLNTPDIAAGHTLDGPQIVTRRLGGDALESMFHPLRLELLDEQQADRALAEGRAFCCEAGHEWNRTRPAPHGPKVPSTTTMGRDGNVVAW
jgi:hypothetical protein